VQLAHPVAPRGASLVAADQRGLQRAGDGQDLGQVRAPGPQHMLDRRDRLLVVRLRDGGREPAPLVAVAGHRREQPGAVAVVEVDQLAGDARVGRDVLHGDRARAVLVHAMPGGVEDLLARLRRQFGGGHGDPKVDTCPGRM
jgi:hypothetical protein